MRFFQLAFFQLLLALDAVARPGHGFQALGIDLIAAVHALAKFALADPLQSGFHHRQQLAVIVALRKQELFGVRAGSTVGYVLRCVLIGNASVLFSSAYHLTQRQLPLFESFFKAFQLLFVHVSR